MGLRCGIWTGCLPSPGLAQPYRNSKVSAEAPGHRYPVRQAHHLVSFFFAMVRFEGTVMRKRTNLGLIS
jgi:hypothetical protein